MEEQEKLKTMTEEEEEVKELEQARRELLFLLAVPAPRRSAEQEMRVRACHSVIRAAHKRKRKKKRKKKLPKASSSRSLRASHAARTRSSGHYFHARCLVRQWIHSLRQSWWLWSDPLPPAVARSVLGVTEEYKDFGILGDDALFPYFRNAWYCVSSVRSRRLVVDNGGMGGFAGYHAPRLCSSWFAQAKIFSILAGMVQMEVPVTCTRLVVLVAMHLARCHEFGGVWILWCRSDYPLCVGYWLRQHSANSVLYCALLVFLVFGVWVSPVEHWIIGFLGDGFYDVSVLRSAWSDGGYTHMRQSMRHLRDFCGISTALCIWQSLVRRCSCLRSTGTRFSGR